MTLAASTACGLAMAAAAATGASGPASKPAMAAALLAACAVLAGLRWRGAATGAVLLAAVAIGLADPPTLTAAVAGLAAVGHLLLRHPGTGTVPTVTCALGFTVAGLVAAVFPWSLPWLPLAAPFAALGLYVVAAQPFLSGER